VDAAATNPKVRQPIQWSSRTETLRLLTPTGSGTIEHVVLTFLCRRVAGREIPSKQRANNGALLGCNP